MEPSLSITFFYGHLILYTHSLHIIWSIGFNALVFDLLTVMRFVSICIVLEIVAFWISGVWFMYAQLVMHAYLSLSRHFPLFQSSKVVFLMKYSF